MADLLKELSDIGVSVWLDDLSRTRLRTGQLTELAEKDHVVGVTTNPAIFSAAIGDGTTYAEQIKELAAKGATVEEAVTAMTSDDVREACDIMRPIFDATNGQDGRVSIEVDPRISADREATIAQAKALHALVDRPNVLIKIPATKGSIPAISDAIAAGISINVTLIFTIEQYVDVLDAYMEGLERAKASGLDLGKIRSVASVFVSRLDTMIDPMLDAIGTPEAKALRSKAAVANARLSFEAYEKVMASDRWKALEAAGAHKQRPLWASTGVKDASLSPTLYVDELAAPETVNTMPEATLRAVAAGSKLHGNAIEGTYEESREVIAGLGKVGIDFDDCAHKLLVEGVEKFEVAWVSLLDKVQAALDAAK
ncbi:MAG: transaldolase [Actinomycetaceae bacterium]|nr:transaldolase [Actinomycetaceae bacterium]